MRIGLSLGPLPSLGGPRDLVMTAQGDLVILDEDVLLLYTAPDGR